MNKKVSTLLITALLTVSTSTCLAAPNYSYSGGAQRPGYQSSYYPAPMNRPYNNTLRGRVVTVPSGQTLVATTTAPISSSYSTTGQPVSVALGSDFTYNGNMIAPAGSTVSGTVIEAKSANHGSVNGKLCIRFNQIVTPYGLQIPISAIIKTNDGSGVLLGGTKTDVAKSYAKSMGVGAGAGALTGLVASAIAGGSVGKGTAIMTGIGAGAGLLKSGWSKGNEVEIPAGASLELMLTQPVTVSPSSYDYER